MRSFLLFGSPIKARGGDDGSGITEPAGPERRRTRDRERGGPRNGAVDRRGGRGASADAGSNRRGNACGRLAPGIPAVPRHTLCGAAGREVALAPAAEPACLDGRAPRVRAGRRVRAAGDLLAPGSPASWHEDCLYLNVYAPAAEAGGKRPVMVWFHGGGWVNGAGTDVQPSWLAAEGNVVVTVNYRLGALGYLAAPALDAQSSDKQSSGQYGDLDKVEALRWVQRNIASFGGDPERVTIAGRSAGAGSVCWLMASPTARGLFQRAVIQSIGDCVNIDHKEAVQRGARFARPARLRRCDRHGGMLARQVAGSDHRRADRGRARMAAGAGRRSAADTRAGRVRVGRIQSDVCDNRQYAP